MNIAHCALENRLINDITNSGVPISMVALYPWIGVADTIPMKNP